ncbi:integrase, catalytic region, zinc finger, CCHC-type containing protein, partial [Tanacetum coccineum]
MTGNLKLLTNFVEKFLGTVKYGNDQIALILGYGDLVQGTIIIKRIYYIKGLNHNLFSIGQFCDADLEVAYICDLKGNDLLTGSRGTYMYSITLQETSTPNPICLMAKATSSQAWLWHRLHAQVTTVQTDKGMEFLNKTLHAYFAKEGVRHETSTARTPEQNGVVKRRNRTLVEAARTMLSAAKVPLFFWAEAIATTFETIHVNFDELPQMALDHISSDPVPQCPTTVLKQDSLSPGLQSQENVPQAAETVT